MRRTKSGGGNTAEARLESEGEVLAGTADEVTAAWLAGRTAEDVLGALRQRIENDPASELYVAAEEQRKITRLRLKSMLSS